MVNKIVLIPSKFDGVNKNWLCNFYEKNGFAQERNGFPFYIKKIWYNYFLDEQNKYIDLVIWRALFLK